MPDSPLSGKSPPCKQCVAAAQCPLRETGEVHALRLRPSQRVMHEGDADTPVLIVKQGLLAVNQRGPDGRERPIAVLGAGCLVGQSALLGLPALFSADAITPAAVCRQSALEMNGQLHMSNASTLFWQQTRVLVLALAAWSHLQRLPSLRQRLAAALLQLAAQQGHSALMLPRQAVLAELLGVTRESISRAWRELLEQRLVHRLAPRSYVLDIAGLRLRLEQAQQK